MDGVVGAQTWAALGVRPPSGKTYGYPTDTLIWDMAHDTRHRSPGEIAGFPPQTEAQQQADYQSLHDFLGIVALVPVANEYAATVSTLLDVAGGNYAIAAMDSTNFIPFVADIKKVVKLGKAARAAGKVIEEKVTFTYTEKIAGQMNQRGWTDESIQHTLDHPAETVETTDTRFRTDGTRNNDPATAYINSDGSYVVRNNRTGDIVQVSNRNNPNWKSPFGPR